MRRKNLLPTLMILAGLMAGTIPHEVTFAKMCPELRVVFARGSGSGMEGDGNYDEFKRNIEEKLVGTSINYEFINLDYPAIGINDPLVLLGTYFGAGEAYEFGESVKSGVKKLDNLMNDGCVNTKYVLGGYSQGAMVISKALPTLDPSKIIYAATFGDPKLYLPEGAGFIPPACRNENLSDYRKYVPDCQAYEGILGSYRPYQPEAYIDKLGTWCNKSDIMCSSHLSISDHVSYAAEGLYEDASRVIFDKITRAFGVENHYSSPHDTAIMIDTTGSMGGVIDSYRAEALRLAEETFSKNGRVALYEYGDIEDMHSPVLHCDFETCTLDVLKSELDSLYPDGGGDEPESMLSSSLHVMRTLNWRQGATKSLIVLTDAGYHSPDRDGTTVLDVINASRSIDPVVIYVVGDPWQEESYREVTTATGGKFVSVYDDFSLITDEVLARYESLPAVEISDAREKPTLEVLSADAISENEIKIKIKTTGAKTLVAIDDAVLGATDETEFVISGINKTSKIMLVPLGDDIRGEGVYVEVGGYGGGSDINRSLVIPLAPNTGVPGM